MPTVARDSFIASGMRLRSEPISVTCATSIAMSVPLPIAMLTSAAAKAWVSFMPSPTIATCLPSACSCLTMSSLSCGITLLR